MHLPGHAALRLTHEATGQQAFRQTLLQELHEGRAELGRTALLQRLGRSGFGGVQPPTGCGGPPGVDHGGACQRATAARPSPRADNLGDPCDGAAAAVWGGVRSACWTEPCRMAASCS